MNRQTSLFGDHWSAVIKEHWRLGVIILIYVTITVVHSRVLPLTLGNDEWAHFLYTRFITEHGRLPINLAERQNRNEVGTKSDDPPLYHLAVAAIASAMELEPSRLLRPVNGQPQRQLADNFVVSYAFVVHNAYEKAPYQGEVLLWHIGRTLSTLFGAVLIILTYLTSLELWLNRRRRALVSAAGLAFIPAFIFHNSVMTYDGLGAVFTALFLLAGIKVIKRPRQWRWWLSLGTLGGLAITTKYSSVLLPFEIVFITWLAVRGVNRRMVKGEVGVALPLSRIFASGLALILATSWWFGFVVWHYNTVETQGPVLGLLEPLLVRGGHDSTAISMTAALFGEGAVSVDLPPPARERSYPQLASIMIQSFWSAVIAEKFSPGISPWLTLVYTAAALLSAVGLWRIWQKSKLMTRTWLALLLFHTWLIAPLIFMRVFVSFDPLEAVQGRHILFPGASAIAILLVWGWEQWSHKMGQLLVAGLLLWSVTGQLGWAAVVYPAPLPVWADKSPENSGAQAVAVDKTFVGAMQLLEFSWQESTNGSSFEVTLWWKSQASMFEDYLIELALLDGADDVVSYTVDHPVQGRYPTRAWEPGDVIKDTHWLPQVMPLNGAYRLQLRLLDHTGQPLLEEQAIVLGQVVVKGLMTGSTPCVVWFQGQPNHGRGLIQPYRLRATFTVIGSEPPKLISLPDQSIRSGQDPFISVNNFHIFMVGPDWPEAYQLVASPKGCHELSFDLPPRDFEPPQIPSPMVINFNNEVQLLGYELPTRRIQPGERLPLALYWQSLAYMGEDYQIFDNLLDVDQQRWGGYDRRAQDGYSTLLWAPGEFVTDRFGVPIDPAAPDGIYTLDLGWYRKSAHGAISLPVFVANEPIGQTSFRLGPIKVGGPPPDVVVKHAAPQKIIKQFFGDQITLLGYDITGPNADLGPNNLKLTLYWQADMIPATDYTTFLHLRANDGQTIAQKDQPPANGRYPTSLWDAGEIIVDEITLSLETVPAGEYTAVVGLYELGSGVRLPIDTNPHGELHLESIILQ